MGLCDMPAAFCVCDTCLACVLGVCVTLAFGRGTGDARRPLITLSATVQLFLRSVWGPVLSISLRECGLGKGKAPLQGVNAKPSLP